MSNSTCISCQDKLDCSDSVLSIIGNVAGILTFIVAIFFSVQAYFDRLRAFRDTCGGYGADAAEVNLALFRLGRRCQELLEQGRTDRMPEEEMKRFEDMMKNLDQLARASAVAIDGLVTVMHTKRNFVTVALKGLPLIEECKDIINSTRAEASKLIAVVEANALDRYFITPERRIERIETMLVEMKTQLDGLPGAGGAHHNNNVNTSTGGTVPATVVASSATSTH